MNKPDKLNIFVFLGGPGSGKTYFATNLARETGLIRLSSDAMRLAIFGSREVISEIYQSKEREVVNTYVHGALDYVFSELLKNGQSIICDSLFNRYADRERLGGIAAKYGAQVIILHIKTPHELALKRGQERDEADDSRKLSEALMREAIERYQTITDEPDANELVIKIDGTTPFDKQYKSFKEQLEEFDS